MAKLIVVDGKLGMVNGRLVTDENDAPCCCGPPPPGDCDCAPQWIFDAGGGSTPFGLPATTCAGDPMPEEITFEVGEHCCGVGFDVLYMYLFEGTDLWTCSYEDGSGNFHEVEVPAQMMQKLVAQGSIDTFPLWQFELDDDDVLEASGTALAVKANGSNGFQTVELTLNQWLKTHVNVWCPQPITSYTGPAHPLGAVTLGPPIHGLFDVIEDIVGFPNPPNGFVKNQFIQGFHSWALNRVPGPIECEDLNYPGGNFDDGASGTLVADHTWEAGAYSLNGSLDITTFDNSPNNLDWKSHVCSFTATGSIVTVPHGFCDGALAAPQIREAYEKAKRVTTPAEARRAFRDVIGARNYWLRQQMKDRTRKLNRGRLRSESIVQPCRVCGGPTTPGPCGACLQCGTSKGGCG